MTIRQQEFLPASKKKNDQNSYFLTFAVHFAIECELTPPK